jgi:hypothetical protein
MKKLYLIIFFLVFSSSLMPERFLYSAEETKESPKKVIVFSFNKGTVKTPETKKKDKESFDYLSEILASSIKIDIDKKALYETEFVNEAPEWGSPEARSGNNFSVKMKEEAAAKSADFIVTGIYSIDGKNLSVDSSIFVSRTGKIISVSAKAELGVILDAVIANLSDGIESSISSSILRPAGAPTITTSGDTVQFAGTVTLTPDQPGDEIWYTLNGTVPSKETQNGYKYTTPLSLRSSSHILAVTSREGFYESKPADKNITVRDPLSYFTFGISFSSEVYLDKWSAKMARDNTNGLTIYGLWELANISGIRTTSFWKNTALYFGCESISGGASSSSNAMTMFSGIFGFAYIVRAADFLTFDLIPMGGYVSSKVSYNSNNSGDPLSGFNLSSKSASSSLDPWAGCGLYANFNFGSGIFIRLGSTYRHVFYIKNPSDSFSAESGVGYRF